MTDHPLNEPQGEEPVTGMSSADQQAFVASMNTHGPYTLGPDSLPQDGVPRGALTQHRWERSTTYPDTGRDYWLYLPQQYDPTQPACLMVFQDGPLYLGPDVNAPAVFDNLIHQGAMPVTVGLFVTAGERGPGMPLWGGADNRSLEYDALGDGYARFLLDELLPEVEREYRISADPDERAICGISSGGICAFTVAWERPDAFRKVVSHCGSFTNIRGGHQYPSLIRRAAPKPLRVFLQMGERDLDLVFGHWPLANREMAAALAYHGYDHQLVIGEGGHTLRHGGAIFPETLRWLWRDVRRRE